MELDPSGRLLDFWGAGGGFSEDGTPAKEALLGNPRGLAVDAAGNILYSEEQMRRVRRINRATGLIETVAGIGPAVLGVPGPAVGALFNSFFGDVAVLPNGTLLVGLDEDRRIYSVDSSGRIDFFAGSGWTFNEEGPALETSVTPKGGMDVDSAGRVYFADTTRIGRIGPDGFVRSIAGGPQWGFGGCGYDGDGGPAVSASLCQPWDVVLDSQGNAFIADTNNNRIRRIDAKSGIITTVAGTGPSNGFENYSRGKYCGDGGPAVDACLNSPDALAVEPDGTIYVDDAGNRRLRKIDPSGVISTFRDESTGNLLADGYGGLFLDISMWLAHILPDGTFWAVAGNGERGFSGDGGPAREARISSGYATTRDAEGNLFFWDIGNERVRAIRYGALMAPPDATIEATAAGSTIRTTVRAANGRPIPGVRVDFTAPATGPSCHFQNGANTIGVVTDASGIATTNCVPNCIRAGSFTVTARPLTASAMANVTMSDHAGPCRRRAVRH